MEISEEELKKKIDDAVAEATKGLLTQEQFDKSLSERLNKEKEKHKKELEEKEKTAKMSAEEKMKHDFDMVTKERDELKSSLAAKEHKEKLTGMMAEKKIDNSFYSMFSGIQDMDEAGKVMDKFNETLKSKVDAEVEGKLKSNVPGGNNGNDNVDDAALRRAMGL